jgi:ABC-2 type transport system permease protein
MTVLDTRTLPAEPRLSFGGVLRSELGKLTSLRSTRVAALCVPLLVVAGMLLRAFAYAQTAAVAPVGVPPAAAWTDVLNVGTQAGELAAVVLAALAVGSGYTSRVALTTFTAEPRRLRVLAAQVVAVLVPLAALVVAGFVVGAALAAPLMTSAGLAGPAARTAGPALPDLLVVLALALLTLAVTTLSRSTAAGIAVVLAVVLVLPTVVGLLHRATGVDLFGFLLTYAAPMALALDDPEGAGALVRDAVVTLAWLVVPGAAAALTLVRRDV